SSVQFSSQPAQEEHRERAERHPPHKSRRIIQSGERYEQPSNERADKATAPPTFCPFLKITHRTPDEKLKVQGRRVGATGRSPLLDRHFNLIQQCRDNCPARF